MVGISAVGISVDAYAMVGIDVDSGYRHSDNSSGKRRSADLKLLSDQT